MADIIYFVVTLHQALIEDWLKDRRQRVCIKGRWSGVPQGSVFASVIHPVTVTIANRILIRQPEI